MTRILYNVNIPRFFVSHRLPLALAACDAGYDVHVTTSDTDTENVAKIIDSGLPYHPLPLAQHGINPFSEVKTLQAMLALYRQLQPDIVHHVSIKPVLYGGIAARLSGIRAVVGAMSGLGYVFVDDTKKARLIRQIVRPLLKVALGHCNTAMIFQNEDDLARFVAMGLIAPDKAVLIRGSGVDVTYFVPTPEANGLPVVLFAGRLMWQKGLGMFAEAARRLRHKARFVIVGYAEATSPDTVSQTQLEDWSQEGILEWWGKRDDMPQVFAQSHIVCLPSTYGEGVPKVLIEAAACARPIVTTDTPGCRDIVHDGENGLLVAPHDRDALLSALEQLIDNAQLRQQMGSNGRVIAERDFSLAYVVGETLALYERLLQPALP
ncbi:MAG: glycosyltransferase family 4 protein [Anaerolineae bacterium]|nr:glycosyltransferase family 4 protein [Anaerolineae bacterium]